MVEKYGGPAYGRWVQASVGVAESCCLIRGARGIHELYTRTCGGLVGSEGDQARFCANRACGLLNMARSMISVGCYNTVATTSKSGGPSIILALLRKIDHIYQPPPSFGCYLNSARSILLRWSSFRWAWSRGFWVCGYGTMGRPTAGGAMANS